VYSVLLIVCFVILGQLAFSQSTGSIGGTVTDAVGSTVVNAEVTVRNVATGEAHVTKTDVSGIYLVPSLPSGTYRVEVKSPGMQTTAATGVELSVGSTVRQDFALQVSATSTTVEVSGEAPLIDSSTTTLGSVVDQHTVQEIPLNGRHFIDLALLTPGTVTPPVNGFLTAPLRGQGSFAYNTGGAREDSFNPMINGINLSDPNQNQITFQPTINTVDEMKLDNSTFSAEYGRNSGSILNISTRSGENKWHGEAYEFIRNDFLDARNFSNPTFSAGAPAKEAEFIRNQFGGDGGGAVIKNKLFAFLSYEQLRQRQAVPLAATVLTAAQLSQGLTTGDSAIRALLNGTNGGLPLIPTATSGTNQFSGLASAPVNIEQGTANVSYLLNTDNRLNFYYAIQRDQRNEPPSTDGNSFPGGGDQRNGTRQLFTFNEDWTLSPTLTNEFRAGGNRIHIVFAADNMLAAPAFGIDSGVTSAIGLPQITVTGAFTFGGISGFPQGRGDDVGSFSDTLSWVHGNHIIKVGGEFRRQNSDNFAYTPGTFTFPSITAFLADQASAFSVTNSNRSNRTYGNSIGAFAMDTWKVRPTFTLTLGLRYDWYGTPTEAENRFVVFDPTTDSLEHVGQQGGPSSVYQQSALNFEPRVGLVWDPFKTGKTVVRSAYAIMTDQPTLGLVTGYAGNPPYAFPVSTTAAGLTLLNAFGLASGSVSPTSIAHNYHDAYVSEWNFNIEQQLGKDYGLTVTYAGSKGTDLNIERNYNQITNGVRPYTALSANSPIDPGVPLTNILVYESDGNSSYQALYVDIKKHISKGLQFDGYYARSKSIDENSRNVEGYVIQNSYNIHGDRGLSDFDARNRFVLSGIYSLPFEHNVATRGWQLSLIETLQSGNPLNFHTSTTTFTGEGTLRPNVVGNVITGYSPAYNGSNLDVGWIQNPTVFVNQGSAFGNLGRNVIIGPGLENLDFAIVRNFKIRESLNFQLRGDAYDIFNHPNFSSPNTSIGSSTLGLISATRTTAGDFGSSRQIQLAVKLQF
jgi:hypothetical protein